MLHSVNGDIKMKQKTHYSITELAKKEGVPYYTMIRRVKKGHYPNAYKVGHGWVIPAKDVK